MRYLKRKIDRRHSHANSGTFIDAWLSHLRDLSISAFDLTVKSAHVVIEEKLEMQIFPPRKKTTQSICRATRKFFFPFERHRRERNSTESEVESPDCPIVVGAEKNIK